MDILVNVEDEFLKKNGLQKGSMQLVDKDLANRLLISVENYEKKYASGGSAANTINGLANLGIECGYIGKIGNDDLGDLFKNGLSKNNINPLLSLGKSDTGTAITFITPDSERTFATYLGAALELDTDDLTTSKFINYSIVHLEAYLIGNKQLFETALRIAKEMKMLVSLDLSSYNIVESNYEYLHNIIPGNIDILFANEEEAKALTRKNAEDAIHDLSNICKLAIVKLGDKGSIAKNSVEFAKVESHKVKAMDTTGAGDLYASGFLYGYLKDWSLEKCAKLGSFVAAKVVENIGAQINDSGWKEIKNLVLSMI